MTLPPAIGGVPSNGGRSNGNGHGDGSHDGHGEVAAIGPGTAAALEAFGVRPDLVGLDVADELARLQTDVPADPAP